ncbi:ketoacid CoA transferase [Kineobactrum salinum]|uniref:Ketoacid CoA transferase n=1 Tax=Kineobactrum salinum TaxID=2708301 RepID=A0A6C0U2K0_9GAMM|nr:ketoacid CoA transferase [Kineobactrum salinum]QIB66311.1 ketoacid CoA transferase [Kineobactrum salinum]
MSDAATGYTLAELCIVAAAEAFRHDGEILAAGSGVIPRLAASLAMKTFNPDLMITDAGAFLLGEPCPIGQRPADFHQANETWLGLSRACDTFWSRKCHTILEPSQLDRFGQANSSAQYGGLRQTGAMLAEPRGFPGLSISSPRSFFVAGHTTRAFPPGECDYVSYPGFNPARLARGHSLEDIDIRRVVTDLCVMDFGGPDNQLRLLTLHPGVTVQQVQDNTGFPIAVAGTVPATAPPTAAQLAIIAALDPHQLRATVIADNPPGEPAGQL